MGMLFEWWKKQGQTIMFVFRDRDEVARVSGQYTL